MRPEYVFKVVLTHCLTLSLYIVIFYQQNICSINRNQLLKKGLKFVSCFGFTTSGKLDCFIGTEWVMLTCRYYKHDAF